FDVVRYPACSIQLVGQHQNDVIKRMVTLSKQFQLSVNECRGLLEPFPAAPDRQKVLALLPGNRLYQVIVHAQFATESQVCRTAREWRMIVVTVYPLCASRIKPPGIFHGLTGSDEPDMDLLFVAGCVQ